MKKSGRIFRWGALLGACLVALPALAGGVLKLDKTTFKVNEPIVVHFAGLPGNKQDWITIVKMPSKNAKWEEWYYTKGQKSGDMKFKGLKPGNYEIRLLYDYPKGGDKVHFKVPFTVK